MPADKLHHAFFKLPAYWDKYPPRTAELLKVLEGVAVYVDEDMLDTTHTCRAHWTELAGRPQTQQGEVCVQFLAHI